MTTRPMTAAECTEAMAEIEAGLADLERAKRRIAKGQAMLRTVVDPRPPKKRAGRVVRLDPRFDFTEEELEADRQRLARGTRVAQKEDHG